MPSRISAGRSVLGRAEDAALLLRAWRAELGFALGILRRAPSFIAAAFGRGTMADVALRNARVDPGGIALVCGERGWSHAELGRQLARVAATLSHAGVRSGDTLPILGAANLETAATLLAAQWIGAVPLLIDAERGPGALRDAWGAAPGALRAVDCGAMSDAACGVGSRASEIVWVRVNPSEPISASRPGPPTNLPPRATPHVDCAWVQTSGTTGHPKCSRIRQRRAMIAAHGFARLVYAFRRGDRVASSLSICHATGLLLGLGPALVSRTPLVMLGKFSASRFLEQVSKARATHWLCVGEMGRWLVRGLPQEGEQAHRLRTIVGMGFDGDLESTMEERLGVSRVVQFYGASDGPIALIRLSGPPGAIGRVPMWASRHVVLARRDVEREDLAMDASGYCIRASIGEQGELLIRQPLIPGISLGCFEGYASECETSSRILRSVFRSGDCYFRTSDLARRDRHGFLYFEGRVGESIRWKGINVPAARVAAALCIPGVVADVVVYGVHIHGLDGTPPAAAVVWEAAPHVEILAERARTLCDTERPRFIRIVSAIERTVTLRPRRTRLAGAGVDPTATSDPLYIWLGGTYQPMDGALYSAVVRGEVRL